MSIDKILKENHIVHLYLKDPQRVLQERWIKGDINDEYALIHYNKHVLKRGETQDLGEWDLKFQHMSKEEYLKQAEELADSRAYNTDKLNKRVTGFSRTLPEDRDGPRFIKVRKNSIGYHNLEEFVIYKRDKSNGEPLIISYYITNHDKLFKELKF